MSDEFLIKVLNGDINIDIVVKWLQNGYIQEEVLAIPCTRIDFVLYLISFLRNQTISILQKTPAVDIATDKVIHSESVELKPEHVSDTLPLLNDCSIISEKNVPSIRKIDSDNTSLDTKRETEKSLSNNISNVYTTPVKKSLCESTLSNVSPINEDDVNFSTPNNSIQTTHQSTPFKVLNINSPKTSDWHNTSLNKKLFSTPIIKNHKTYRHFENNQSKTCNVNPRSTDNSQYSFDRPTSQRTNICIGDFIVSKHNQHDKNGGKKKKTKYVNLSLDENAFHIQTKYGHNATNIKDENAFHMQTKYGHNATNIKDENCFPDIRTNRNEQKRRINPTRLNKSDQSSSCHFQHNTPNSNIRFGEKCYKVEQSEAFKNQIFHPSEKDMNFETERNILKLEKEKLLQKFCTLNSSTLKNKEVSLRKISSTGAIQNSEKCNEQISYLVTPSLDNITNITFLDKLSILYTTILNFNLAVNFTAEINFLISLLVSQDMSRVNLTNESNLPHGTTPNIKSDSFDLTSLLSNIHNCVYFSLKTLNSQVLVLDLILDNATLRLLYQNVRVKLFCPDLSEHLKKLHISRQNNSDVFQLQTAISNKNVCFIADIDSEENFNNQQSFYVFKKQRDLFYDILRSWENQHNSANWNFSLKLGAMIHNLLTMSVSCSNVTHLARLFREQLIATCTGHKIIEEDSLPEVAGVSADRLSKLAQRLVAAPTTNTSQKHLKPDFPDHQEFFRDFLIFADNSSFRHHVMDSLIEEINRLNNIHFISTDEENINHKIKSYYLSCVISLQLLGKFLGFLMSLPYRNPLPPPPPSQRHAARDITPLLHLPQPRERVLQNDIQVRRQTQPILDLQEILNLCIRNRRLILTIPWVLQLLAMLDYSSLRLPYYKKVIEIICEIYSECYNSPSLNENNSVDSFNNSSNGTPIPQASQIFLKICIGWFFDMIQFPQHLFYSWIRKNDSNPIENRTTNSKLFLENKCIDDAVSQVAEQISQINMESYIKDDKNSNESRINSSSEIILKTNYMRSNRGSIDEQYDDENGLDFVDLIDWNIILSTCPHLKELKCKLQSNQEISSGTNNKTYRHITPVTSGLAEDVIKRNKEKQIQVQLEEWFLRSQSQSTSRVLRSVGERVGSALLRLIRSQLPYLKTLSQCGALHLHLQHLPSIEIESEIRKFNECLLIAFKVRCYNACKVCGRERTVSALKGMLAPATATSVFNLLVGLSLRRALDMVTEWLNNNVNTEMLCYDVNPDPSKISKIIDFNEIEKYLDVKRMEEKNDQFIDVKKNVAHKSNIFYSGANCIIMIKDLCLQLISGIIFKNSLEVRRKAIEECINNATLCSQCSHIQNTTKSIIGQLTIDLAILIIALVPTLLTADIMKLLKDIWNNSLMNKNMTNNKANTSLSENCTKRDVNNDEVELFQKYMCENGPSCNITIGAVNQSMGLLEEESLCEYNKSLTTQNISIKNKEDKTEDICKLNLSKQFESEVDNRNNEFFSTILCSRNILYFGELGGGNIDVWKKLAEFLAFLLSNEFITEDSLTDQCLAIYRQEWPQETLENFSSCIQELSDIYKLSSNKLRLFLDFVVEFCHNISGDYLEPED